MRTLALPLTLLLASCGASDPKPAEAPPAAAQPEPAASADPCGPGDDVEQGARTVGAGAEAGGRTAVEGVKTFGGAVGGWLEGGSDEAKKEWEAGKEKTRATAKRGAGKVNSAATTRPCTPAPAPSAAPAPAPAPS